MGTLDCAPESRAGLCAGRVSPASVVPIPQMAPAESPRTEDGRTGMASLLGEVGPFLRGEPRLQSLGHRDQRPGHCLVLATPLRPCATVFPSGCSSGPEKRPAQAGRPGGSLPDGCPLPDTPRPPASPAPHSGADAPAGLASPPQPGPAPGETPRGCGLARSLAKAEPLCPLGGKEGRLGLRRGLGVGFSASQRTPPSAHRRSLEILPDSSVDLSHFGEL